MNPVESQKGTAISRRKMCLVNYAVIQNIEKRGNDMVQGTNKLVGKIGF